MPQSSPASAFAVYPSVYLGGTTVVDTPGTSKCTLINIVCHDWYSHLSPEELRFKDLKIILRHPPCLKTSVNEKPLRRSRRLPNKGLNSTPQFGPPIPSPLFSFAAPVKPTSSGLESSLGLGRPIPPTVVDESTTSTCSLCAARLAAEADGDEEHEDTSEGLGRDTPNPRHGEARDHKEQKARKRLSRRVRRLEKTVESLSNGLILALTELQNRTSPVADGRKSAHVDALSAVLSDLSVVDRSDSTPGTSAAPDGTIAHLSEPAARRRESTKPEAAEHRDDSSISVIRDCRSPISGLLKPILDCMVCPEVNRFLKWVESHPGLKSTQLSDLLWVSHNFFDVHGGVMIYCLQTSLISMDEISTATGLRAWTQNPGLMQNLDETYRKLLRPHIDTVGSHNSVAKAAWDSYCLELGGIFSRQFPQWKSTTAFFNNLSSKHDFFGPIITSSYIEDLNSLWTEVHPALLEITRWLEPFIDYGPDYQRTTPFYDATITVGRHARELSNRKLGPTLSGTSSCTSTNNLMRLLCKYRAGDLKTMQHEMESMNSVDAGAVDADISDIELAALVERTKNATLWRVEEPRAAQMQEALARREVRVMRAYRPALLRAGTAAARIRREVVEVVVGLGAKAEAEAEVFWDGCKVVA